MLEIFVYAFGIMYSPGPANMLSLTTGINGRFLSGIRFSLGVASAMFLVFLLIGYLGAGLIPESFQSWIGKIGGLYIAYLGWKIMKASFNQQLKKADDKADIGFISGFILQLFNPKAPVAIIPIATVQFPQAGIYGEQIALFSFVLSCMAFGAPASYLLIGSLLKNLALNARFMAWINRVMAMILWYVAVDFIFLS